MKARRSLIALLALSAALAGCQTRRAGRTRLMGSVEYPVAFATSRRVLTNYFVVTEANPDTGKIQCLPKDIAPPPERLIGRSPARQQATLWLRRDGKTVSARLAVAVQRQTRAIHRQMANPGENYEEVPYRTPAQAEAATTPDQNDTWVTQGYAHDVEIRILDDIYKALHPAGGE